MKIYAPVKETNGVRASVRFVRGVGETDDPRLIEWFRSHGYRVEESEEIPQRAEMLPAAPVDLEQELEMLESGDQLEEEPDFDAMNPNELRDWMKEHGLGMQMKNIRNKEKLLEIIRG